jgi:hypothetical protein
MQKTINWFITDQNVTVNYQGQTHIVKRSDALADDLIRAIKENRLDDVPNLVSVARAMENKSKGNVLFRDGELLVKGVRVPAELACKIQKFIDEGLPYQPLVKFAENLQKNPSFRAVNELFQFLEKNDHPLTENGTFLAFKKVQEDFTDVHTGKFDNHPGQVLEMPRNQVDEDPTSHCSHGFHVGNWRYCHEFNGNTGIMLEVEVNPADVVAVPTDLNEKIRVCRYKVLGVVDSAFSSSPLRVIDKNTNLSDDIHSEEAAEEECCAECGESCCEGGCADDDGNFCLDCDCEIPYDYELCEDCELIREEEEEECESCGGNHQNCDGDEYPWEDEI